MSRRLPKRPLSAGWRQLFVHWGARLCPSVPKTDPAGTHCDFLHVFLCGQAVILSQNINPPLSARDGISMSFLTGRLPPHKISHTQKWVSCHANYRCPIFPVLALHVDLVIQMWDVQNDGVPTPLLTSQLWCSEIVSWCAAAEEEGAGPEGALDLYVVAFCCFCCAAAILLCCCYIVFLSTVVESSVVQVRSFIFIFFRWQPLIFFCPWLFLASMLSPFCNSFTSVLLIYLMLIYRCSGVFLFVFFQTPLCVQIPW